MYDPEVDKIIEEADNGFEAFFAVLLHYIVKFIFHIMEVVVEFGTNTQESNQES